MPPAVIAAPFVGDAASIATAVGLVSSGMLSGGILGLSAVATPALLGASHSPDQTLLPKLFARLYNRGKVIAVPLASVAALAFGYTSYAHWTHESDRWTGYLAASVACASIVPFTLIVMKCNIDTLLRAAEAKDEGGEGKGLLTADRQVQELVKWARLNFIRGSMPLVGFAVALWFTLP